MRKDLLVPSGAILLVIAFGLVMGKVSARFPPVYSDEVVFSVHGYNLLTGQGHRYSLYDDIFDRSVYPIRDALPDITRILYNAWDGLWLKYISRTYRQARWSSVAAGMLVLLVFYQIGRTLRGPVLGLAAVALCAMNPVMMYSSCIVRPEILLLLGASLGIWLILRLPSTWTWKPFTIGVGVGLLSAVHWNAAALGAGLLVVYALVDGRAHRLRRLLWMISGMAAGALVAFRMVDPEKFLLSLRTVNYLVSTPSPIVSDPLHPWRWIWSTLCTFFTGQTSFFNTNLVPGWQLAMGMSWIGIFAALTGSYVLYKKAPRAQDWKTALAVGLLTTLVAMLCLIKRQEVTYGIILFPFLMPLLADCWASRPMSTAVFRLRALAGLFMVGSVILYAHFVVRYIQRSISYDQIAKELHEYVPDASLRLAGPSILWFTWYPEKFRDIGAIITSGWYTGGRRDLAGCLSPWKPEVLVIDPVLRHRLWGSNATLPQLRKTLKARIQYLGLIHTADNGEQDWELYRLFWGEDEGARTMNKASRP
jgi:hypothetical protein